MLPTRDEDQGRLGVAEVEHIPCGGDCSRGVAALQNVEARA
jgi:hypothetical protein